MKEGNAFSLRAWFFFFFKGSIFDAMADSATRKGFFVDTVSRHVCLTGAKNLLQVGGLIWVLKHPLHGKDLVIAA